MKVWDRMGIGIRSGSGIGSESVSASGLGSESEGGLRLGVELRISRAFLGIPLEGYWNGWRQFKSCLFK